MRLFNTNTHPHPFPSPFSLRRIFVATRKYILHGVWAWYLCEQWLLRWTPVYHLCPWEVFEFKVPFSFRPLPSTSLPSPPLPSFNTIVYLLFPSLSAPMPNVTTAPLAASLILVLLRAPFAPLVTLPPSPSPSHLPLPPLISSPPLSLLSLPPLSPSPLSLSPPLTSLFRLHGVQRLVDVLRLLRRILQQRIRYESKGEEERGGEERRGEEEKGEERRGGEQERK